MLIVSLLAPFFFIVFSSSIWGGFLHRELLLDNTQYNIIFRLPKNAVLYESYYQLYPPNSA